MVYLSAAKLHRLFHGKSHQKRVLWIHLMLTKNYKNAQCINRQNFRNLLMTKNSDKITKLTNNNDKQTKIKNIYFYALLFKLIFNG